MAAADSFVGDGLALSPYAEVVQKLEEVTTKYNELLYAVASKWPNESRHETALRYIRAYEIFNQQNSWPAKTLYNE